MFINIKPIDLIVNSSYIKSIAKHDSDKNKEIHIYLNNDNLHILKFDSFEDRNNYLNMLTITLGVNDVD